MFTILSVITVLTLFSTPVFAATQSHPISQITPVDANFNMSSKNITNISYAFIDTSLSCTGCVGSAAVADNAITTSKIASGVSLTSANINATGWGNFSNVNVTNNVTIGGYVGIGTTGPTNKLQISSGHIGVDAGYGLVTIDSNWTGFAAGTINSAEGTYVEGFGKDFSGDAAGQLRIKAGTVTSPSGNQGNILFYTGSNVERMRIDRSGNVGIGTTSPAEGLTVVPNVSLNGTLYVNNSRVGIGTTSPNAKLEINGSASNGLSLNVTNDLFVNDTSGNVGIGTTNPGEKLHVSGGDVLLDNGQILEWKDSSGNIDNILYLYTDNNFYFDVNENIIFRLGGTIAEKMRITAGGNVGIGTTSPAEGLTVAPNVSLNGTLYVNNSKVGIGTTSPNAKLEINGSASNGLSLNVTNDLFVNDTSGNVGIGTAGPKKPLHIYTSGTAIDYANDDATGAGILIEAASQSGGVNGNLAIYTTDAQAANIGGSIVLGGKFTTGNNNVVTYGKIFAGKETSTSGEDSGYMAFWTRLSGSGSTEKMRITSAGNVGIGTTAPKGLLQINTTIASPNLIIAQNTTVIPCNSTFAGGIIYTNSKHYGCDGSIWNAFY